VAHLRTSLVVTSGAANELTECYEKIRTLEYDLVEKNDLLRTQEMNYKVLIEQLKKQKEGLQEDIDNLRESERVFQLTKKQNQ